MFLSDIKFFIRMAKIFVIIVFISFFTYQMTYLSLISEQHMLLILDLLKWPFTTKCSVDYGT